MTKPQNPQTGEAEKPTNGEVAKRVEKTKAKTEWLWLHCSNFIEALVIAFGKALGKALVEALAAFVKG